MNYEELIARCELALDGVTPGPWGMETKRTSCGVCHQVGPWPHKWRAGDNMSACIYDDYPSPPEGTDSMLANARFIAAARQDVPDILAALKAVMAEREADAELMLIASRQMDGANAEVAALRARVAELEGALTSLEKQASITANRGAVTGPHWVQLNIACLSARAALRAKVQP